MNQNDINTLPATPPDSKPIKPASVLKPWANSEAFVPESFRLDADGVYRVKGEGEQVRISGPVWVSAKTRDHNKNGWGIVVHWIDADASLHQHAFPSHMLHERGAALALALAAEGLSIVPGKERLLLEYLGSFEPLARLQSVSRLGWLDGDDARAVYVSPDRILGSEQCECIIYQPERYSPTVASMHARGSLEDWKRRVAEQCAGNPILMFFLGAAFVGPLLKYANMDSGGFHLYGDSSKGKTTALQVAASVWGCGADPGVSERSHVRRWNSTGNALEAVAAAHNDGLLVLDELGTCSTQDFGKVVYDLFGGLGKSRLTQDALLRESRAWRIQALSTGEISSTQKIEEFSRNGAKAGQRVRLIDIPIDDKIIINTHGLAAPQFVDRLKAACAHCYGVAGLEFVARLIALQEHAHDLRRTIVERIEPWTDGVANGLTLDELQRRALRRFALVAVAGQLAAELEILPFKAADLDDAIMGVWDRWHSDTENVTDAERGIRAIREFILRHREARFRDVIDRDSNGAIVRDLAGYVDRHGGETLYEFTTGGFKEACFGYNQRDALRELYRRGLLWTNETDRHMAKVTVDGERLRVYAVKSAILE